MDSSFWIPVLSVLVAVPAAILAFLQITDRINLFRGFPLEVYRVTYENIKEGRGRGLWPTPEARDALFELSTRKTDPPTCSFFTRKSGVCVIEGPLRLTPLPPGKYRATFRFQVHEVNVQARERYLLKIHVLSHRDGNEDPSHYKILAQRVLTTGDFETAGKDKDFSLDFEVYLKIGGGEQKVEFCTISGESGIQVTFDSVRLSRR